MFKKILMLLAVLMPTVAFAQKFGTVDMQSVIEAMPDYAAMQTQMQAASNQFSEELQKLSQELEKLYTEFQTVADDPNTPQSIKERRMSEIQEKQTKAQQFRQQAEQDLSRQNEQLTAPIVAKFNDAVKAVGQEGGYTLIFPKEDGLLLYMGADVTDVTPLVKTKLGL